MAGETLMLMTALAGLLGAKLALLTMDYAPVLARKTARPSSPDAARFARTV